MNDAAGAQAWSFDVGGRVLTDRRTNNSVTKAFGYTYNLIGGLTTLSYPSGRMITYTYNDAGRLFTGKDVNGGVNYATGPCSVGPSGPGACYEPHGALRSLHHGASIVATYYYNSRLQQCRFRVTSAATAAVLCSAADPSGDVFQMKYSYNHGTANNGNVMSWSATGAQSFSRGYTYDELNRLKAMASTGTSRTALEWTYDIWANRTNQNIGQGGAACGTHHPTINSKNQIVDTGYVYDAAGNMTQEPGKTYQYDAEGRLKSLNNGCPSTLCYTYDANGRRVRKIASGVTTEYIYGAGGVVAEKVGTTWTVGYVYLNGQLLAQYKNGTTRFAHKDHLGSIRLLTKPDGSYDSADVYDFLPYGEPVGTQSATTSHKFTGNERDAESGLDYFGARYYSSNSGRFNSVDPIQIKRNRLADLQRLNLYGYARNNPLSYFDPDGRDAIAISFQKANYAGMARIVGNSLWGPGHAGMVTVNSKGRAFYYDKNMKGAHKKDLGTVPVDKDGKVTNEGLATTLQKLSKEKGESGAVKFAYFKADDETVAAINGAYDKRVGNPSEKYNWNTNNCADFVADGLEAGGLAESNSRLPNNMLEDVKGKAEFTGELKDDSEGSKQELIKGLDEKHEKEEKEKEKKKKKN